ESLHRFSFYCYGVHRPLHSFPTRRSSDLAPLFEIDPPWPKPLPNHWILGSTIGMWVDTDDHVWIIHRSSATLGNNEKTLETKQRSEEHTSELQSRRHLVCRLLLEKKKKQK